jgi:diguanylate cyclase (GGDEF)-like protein
MPMDIPVRTKGRGRAKEIYSSYGELAGRLLPAAAQISFFGASGELEWTRGSAGNTPQPAALVARILSGNLVDAQVARLSGSLLAVAIPINLDGKPVSILQVTVASKPAAGDERVMRDTVGAAAPLVDCLCRELGQQLRKALPSATLSERTEELEWLFALTENLHSNSSDPRAINQVLGAAVERMRACFGAVVVPEHGLELTYASMVRIDPQSAGIFARCRPYFLNFVTRRKQPLIANKATAGGNMPPFKVLVVPIEPHKGRVIGYVVFLKTAALPSFGRRQLFLGRHIGHQVGTLLESQYDLATGLLTRSAFEQDVLRTLHKTAGETLNCLLYFDIDRLHVINDVLGFGFGDEAIVRVAELFQAPELPDDAVTSRIGGDSFLVYLPNHDADQAAARAARILAAAGECCIGPEPKQIALSLSCGVVRLLGDTLALGGPIATAQIACAHCKEHGGNRVEIRLEVDAGVMRRKAGILDASTLRNALADGRFCIYAQKIVSSSDFNEIHGIECLVRMQGEDGRIIGPADFFPTAQRHQLLQVIDLWVISKALRELREFRTTLLDSKVHVAINISGQSIQDETFVDTVERRLNDSGVAPGLILFEIAETAAISYMARAERLMGRLRQRGCLFSLDDFGTGINSLSYLKILPISHVKIDGSFTRDLESIDRADDMVQTIAQMSRALGIESVAECVESQPAADRLRVLGVPYIQGFTAHRPEPLRELLGSIQFDESQRRRPLCLDG